MKTSEVRIADSTDDPKRRIRVLHSVGHLLRGGIEMWLYQMLQKFDADRFEHHVLVRTDKEEPFTEAFREAGFRVLPCLNYSNPVKYRGNLRRVIEANGPYDVLHVHGSNPNGLLALLFAKRLGISATIVHSHNDLTPLLENRGIAYRTYVGMTLLGLRTFADRGFAASFRAADSMFGPAWRKDKRWQLLYYGVNFEPFTEAPDLSLRENLGIPEGAFVIGHVGRFHEQKNHEFLLRIAGQVSRKCPDAHFLLIGDGPLRSQIVSEVQNLGIASRFTFVPDTLSVPQFMLSAMDCFVLPSRYEGLGLVAVEAQAAGLPCFLSDRVPEEAVVDVNLVDFLRLEDSPEVWARGILAARGHRVRSSGEHLQQFYHSKFNLARCTGLLRAIYESSAHFDAAGDLSESKTKIAIGAPRTDLRCQSSEGRIRVLHSVGHLLRGGIETWLFQMLQRFDVGRFEHHILVRTEKEEPFTAAFRQAGFRVVPCLNYSNPVKYKANLKRVIEKSGPYDVLHVHGSNPNGLLALLFAKRLGIPATVVHSHNDLRPLLESRGAGYRSYVGLTLRGIRLLADRGFAVSALAAESMFGPAWEKDGRWQLLHCGVNFKPFSQQPDPGLRTSLGIPNDAFVVGHVGRFHPQKNHGFLVRIADEVIKQCPNARFLLVGDGDLRKQTMSEVQARGLQSKVVWVADTKAMPQFMLSAMDCFVLPSRYEGLPLVSVEAQAAGLPCFLSDRITKESVVDPTLVKFLGVEDHPTVWAKAILDARGRRIRNPEEHLKQFYASTFNLERCASTLGETYESLADPDRGDSSADQELHLAPRVWKRAG